MAHAKDTATVLLDTKDTVTIHSEDTKPALDIEAENASSNHEEEDEVDPRLERRVVRKLDMVILPLLSLSFMFAYLDRSNIGNARVLGMQADVGLSAQQYLNCVMMFYLGYMLIELPAGMALRYVHPRYCFAGALFAFGAFAALLSISGYAGIMVLRLLIGLAEVFITNSFIYISLWYRHDEMAKRTAAIYVMTPIAGAVSGLLAYGIGLGMEGTHGMEAWKWLFIIEGVATVGFGFVVLFLLPGLPETTAKSGSWLFRDEAERRVIAWRQKRSQNSDHARFQPHQILMCFKDIKFWLGSLMIGTAGIGIGAFSVFLPTFIREFGYGRVHTQLLTMIPYGCGLVSLIFFSWLADYLKQKILTTLGCTLISCVGFVMLLATTNKVALVAGSCFVAAGAYPALVTSVSFVMPMHGGYTKRATGLWGTQVFVQCYSIIATQVYRTPPRFFLGHGIALALYAVGVAANIALYFILTRTNAARERRRNELAERGEVDPDMEKSFEELGDFHPNWKYVT